MKKITYVPVLRSISEDGGSTMMTDRDMGGMYDMHEAEGLASDLIAWLEHRTESGYPTRRAATALGLAAAALLTALREDPRRWADLVVQTAQDMGASTE